MANFISWKILRVLFNYWCYGFMPALLVPKDPTGDDETTSNLIWLPIPGKIFHNPVLLLFCEGERICSQPLAPENMRYRAVSPQTAIEISNFCLQPCF